MLQFLGMKNLLATAGRYIVAFAVAEILATILFTAMAALEGLETGVLALAFEGATAAIPMAALSACFITFFRLNAVIASRPLGLAALVALSASLMAASALPYRFLWKAEPFLAVARLPAAYRPMGQWMLDTAKASWLEAGLGIAAFSAYASSFWACTRLSRGRPLLGAFTAPSAAIGAIALFSALRSNPAAALFEYLELAVSPGLATALLAFGCGIALCILDLLLARKPGAGGRNAG